VYVDSAYALCTGGDGSSAHPYCQPSSAISNLAGHPYVHLAPGVGVYDGIVVNTTSSVTVTFVGPAGGATIGTANTTNTHTVEAVAGGNATVNVTVDGLTLKGSSSASNVLCTSSGSGVTNLVVRDCHVIGGQRGLRAESGCNLTGRECRIEGATIIGAHMDSGSTFLLVNDMIYNNAIGVQIEFSAQGMFQFNTVAYNGSSGPAGVLCNRAITLESSIIFGNAASSGTQLGGSNTCALTKVALGAADSFTSSGKLPGDPVFRAPPPAASLDLRLKVDDAAATAANRTCCIDQVGSGPPIDFEGDLRPKGPAWDVGAHEAL
jgi:hypothetical protein